MNKLLSLLLVFFLVFICTIFFITCEKEYSYEGGNGITTGTAVYTLNGAGGECAGSIISGGYNAGTPMGPGNTIQLQVDVTTIGTYTLNTSSVNDIYFSASGNFTDTGMQSITLAGIGTPASEGSFDFTTPVGEGCFFTVVVNQAMVVMATFTLAGAPNGCEDVLVLGSYLPGQPLDISNTVRLNVNVTAVGAYTISTDTIDGFSFSASGTFTSTGDQTIMLPGSGIPELPRNLVFTPQGGGSACGFTVAVINPEPLATYVLESGSGNPAPCIYTVSGSYTGSIPLDASNSVSIHVFVTVLGNFTIATDEINGILFSSTGTFTSFGAQNVILTGTGIPVVPGNYTFIPQIVGPHPLGGEACAFEIPVK